MRRTAPRLELLHTRNQTLAPDEMTREMASVAANNGIVYGRGRSADGLLLEESTRDRPMLKHVFVDTDVETAESVLHRAAGD